MARVRVIAKVVVTALSSLVIEMLFFFVLRTVLIMNKNTNQINGVKNSSAMVVLVMDARYK